LGEMQGGEKRAQPVHNPCTGGTGFWLGEGD
jgi:hypothetical protein